MDALAALVCGMTAGGLTYEARVEDAPDNTPPERRSWVVTVKGY